MSTAGNACMQILTIIRASCAKKKTEGGSNGQDIPACPEKTGLSEAVFFEDGEGLHLFFLHMLWARKFNDE